MKRVRARTAAVTAVTMAVGALAGAFAAGGCSVFGPPERATWTTFVIEGTAAKPDVAAREGAAEGAAGTDGGGAAAARSIRVAPIESAAGYDSPLMAYSRARGEIEYFARHRWAEPPAQMLAPLLVAALESGARFAAVIAPSSRANADLFLETQLLAFRVETEGAPAFRASIRATLVDSIDGRVVRAARTFEILEPMDEVGPGAGAKAAERAAASLVGEIAAYCAEAAGR